VGKEEEEEEKGEHFVVGFFLQAGIGIMAEAVVEMDVDVGDLGATVVVNRFSVNGMCVRVCVCAYVCFWGFSDSMWAFLWAWI
jgi:hypothetical protein